MLTHESTDRLAIAILDNTPVVATYRDKDGVVSTRVITPTFLRQNQRDGSWFMRAYDHNRRREFTNMRLDGLIHIGTVA